MVLWESTDLGVVCLSVAPPNTVPCPALSLPAASATGFNALLEESIVALHEMVGNVNAKNKRYRWSTVGAT